MTCSECRERLSEFDVGELSPRAAGAVQEHLHDCPACSRLLTALRDVGGLATGLQDDPPARSLALRILAQVNEWTRQDAESLPEIMTPEQLSRFLHVPIEKLDAEGIPGFEVGGELRFRKDRVLQWIEEQEREYERRKVYARLRA